MTTPIDIETIDLKQGGHASRDDGVCAMELVAWMAGEPHSDEPQCASRVIGTLLRAWNDSLSSDEARNRIIRPLLPLVIGTAIGPEAEERRAWMAADWLVRECAPAWLELAGLNDEARALRGLAEIRDAGSADSAHGLLASARKRAAAARDAAGAAIGDAIWASAGDAARASAGAAIGYAIGDAAGAAIGDAIWASAGYAIWASAGAAIGDAIWASARAAARAAAWDTGKAALAPIVERLQESAQQLVIRMCEVGR